MAKIFKSPQGISLTQLSTFTHYIQGEQFRFVITRESRLLPVCVTHRASGKKICEVLPTDILAAAHDYEIAAKSVLLKFIERVGAARVRSVLAAAE